MSTDTPPGSEIAARTSSALSPLDEFRAAMGGSAIPGLESVDSSDISLPMISIDHKKNVFIDKLTGTEYPVLDGVLLGLLKQRVMWDSELAPAGSSTGPMCKSNDAVKGEPRENFPWAEFKKNGGPEPVNAPKIDCATCYFATWGSHPKNDTPWCSLQHVYPVVIGGGENITGLLTLSRSALKPSSAYLTGFVRDAKPLFMYRTTVALDHNKRGSVEYSVPKFSRGEATPEDIDLWRRWAKQYDDVKRAMQGIDLTSSDAMTVPRKTDDDGDSF